MEFGKISEEDIASVNFSLPQDPVENLQVLRRKPAEKTRFYVGCAKWGRKDWIGKIYPKGTKEADFLKHYARFFNTIELNATFYRLPSIVQTHAWASNVNDGFKFCPKFSDKISHLKRLKDVDALTERFLQALTGFGDKLGPIFLMLHPNMGPKSIDTIKEFLTRLPKDIQVFLELRHAQWYSEEDVKKQIFDIMESLNVGTVITDSSGRRDCVHMRLTTPTAFIRFVGNGLHPTDYSRVDEWIGRIRTWQQHGIHAVYFFMHQHEEIHSPELSKYVIEKLNEHCGAGMVVPQFL